VDYRLWAQQGLLKTTPGNVIDIDFLVRDILQICRKYYVKNLAFDPYKAYHGLIQGLIKGGLSEVLDEFSQSITNMSEPTKQLERMVHGREINFLNNPILRWMFSNVVIFADQNNNIKVHKGQSRNKIDGIAALINAIGGYMSNEAELQKSQIYTQHDLRTVNFVL
jgi:phage terminase large subunit-like protein